MASVRERWLIDNYEITSGAVMDVEMRTGLYQRAALVGTNGVVPNRSGEVWRAKRGGPGSFTLNMWLGTNTGRPDVDALYDNLIRAVGDGSRLPTWTRYLADGTVRQTGGEVVGSLAPTALGQQGMRLAVEVSVPSGIWEATVDSSSSTSTNPGTGVVQPLAEFGYVTAPMERLTFTINGPCTQPLVTDITNGAADWFQYDGTIPNNKSLTVNSETWALVSSDPGTFVVDRSAFYYNGPRFLTVPVPKPNAVPKLRFEYANGGAHTQLVVTGRSAFAV